MLRGISYENRLIVILAINFGIVFFDRNALNYLISYVSADLHLTNIQIGLLASATALSWALSGVILGAISDRHGGRKLLLVGATVLFSICSVLSGFAASFAALLAVRLLMGLAEGPVLPISQALVARESSPHRRGLNMGFINNFGSNFLGVLIAPLVLVAVAEAFGWRLAFWLAGVPGLLLALVIARTVREPETAGQPDGGSERPAIGAMVRVRNIWLCMVISCFMLAWTLLGWAFLPLYLVNVRGFSPGTMSLLMAVLGASATICSILVPGLSDRIGRKPVMIMFSLLGALCPLSIIFLDGSVWALAMIMFIGWSASGTLPLFMAALPSESISPRHVGTALGLIMGVGEVVGGCIAPVAAGWMADRHGLAAPLVIAAACAVIASILSLFLRETVAARSRTAARPAESLS
jgi:predicted MFS family arabinose efflux permease